jgi:hypothetical protein
MLFGLVWLQEKPKKGQQQFKHSHSDMQEKKPER